MSNIAVIGAGAAGMMSAILIAEQGHSVTVFEQNERIGKKLYITGKGRCNFTNACSRDNFLSSVISNPRFLYSAYDTMDSEAVIDFFERHGMKTKIERGNRAFPASDKSADVIDTLRDAMRRQGVKVRLRSRVTRILTDEERVTGLAVLNPDEGVEKCLDFDRVIVATGGLSYPSTGATGDGLRFAGELGLRVTKTSPSLVPIECEERYCEEMQGLSLRNVELHIKSGKKEVFNEFGEMMFTHFGVTGPLILTASARIGQLIGKKELRTYIDLKPAVSEEKLDDRILRLFAENPNKAVQNVVNELYPAKMLPVILALCGIDSGKKVHDVTKGERLQIVQMTKRFPLTFTRLRGYNEAVITKGGVSVREIDPGSMEAKKIEGIHFVGEVLDVDALTGGFNLQIAWCTAAQCAKAIGPGRKEM